MKFLDSNILIYAADETDLAKFGRACDIVDAAVRGDGFMISAQVLNEFASVMFKKFKKPEEEVDSSIRCFLRRQRRMDARSSGLKT